MNFFISILLFFICQDLYAAQYIDWENGNNNNTGADTQNAWLNISGASSSLTIPGTPIHVKKTPDPTFLVNATATYGNHTVILDNAVTVDIDNCESGWTASPNVTVANQANSKSGYNNTYIIPSAGFTTGKLAYKTLASTIDASNYTLLNMWAASTTEINSTVGALSLVLCSDTLCDSPISSYNLTRIPAQANGAGFVQQVWDNVSSLPNNINSVGIYAQADPATPTIRIDNIFASPTGGLTLNDIIQNSSEPKYKFGKFWYTVKGVSGTTLELDSSAGSRTLNGEYNEGYSPWLDDSGKVTIYHRRTIPYLAGSTYGGTNVPNEAGSVTSGFIRYSGGWNFPSDIQDGMTWFMGQNAATTYGINSARNWVSFEDFGFARTGTLYFTGGSLLRNCAIVSALSFADLSAIRAYGTVVYLNAVTVLSSGNGQGGPSYSLGLSGGLGGMFWGENIITAGSTYDLYDQTASAFGGKLSNHIALNYLTGAFRRTGQAQSAPYAFLYDSNGFGTTYVGTAVKSSEVYHAAPPSIAFTPSSYSTAENRGLFYTIGRAIVPVAHKQVTVKLWVKMPDTTPTVSAKLYIEGISSVDVPTTTTDWQEVTLTFSTNISGEFPIYFSSTYLSAASTVYIDDISITIDGNDRYNVGGFDYSTDVFGMDTFNANGLSYAVSGGF